MKNTFTQKKPVEVQTKPKKEDQTGKQESKTKKITTGKVQKAPATRRSTEKDESHSIFKGYTGETKKADKRIFTKKYKGTYGISKGPIGNFKLYIQKKWYESRLNKIWICTVGYIFATQIWLCVVTLFTLIIWRIRENT
jgi:hypothetical protein